MDHFFFFFSLAESKNTMKCNFRYVCHSSCYGGMKNALSFCESQIQLRIQEKQGCKDKISVWVIYNATWYCDVNSSRNSVQTPSSLLPLRRPQLCAPQYPETQQAAYCGQGLSDIITNPLRNSFSYILCMNWQQVNFLQLRPLDLGFNTKVSHN